MANSRGSVSILMPSILLLLALTLTLATAGDDRDGDGDGMVHLHFYMHEVVTGPSPTAVRVARGPVPLPGSPYNFGDLVVVDDLLTDGPSAASSRPVGRAQGTFTVARSEPSVHFVLTLVLFPGGGGGGGPHDDGSTVSCVGLDLVVAPVRELAVVGGSGEFRMARGYVLVRTHSINATTGDAVLELDVYAQKHRGKW